MVLCGCDDGIRCRCASGVDTLSLRPRFDNCHYSPMAILLLAHQTTIRALAFNMPTKTFHAGSQHALMAAVDDACHFRS